MDWIRRTLRRDPTLTAAPASVGANPVRWSAALGTLAALLILPRLARAETTTAELKIMVDTIWTVLCGALVFFMNAGFGLLETGLCRAKNAATVMSKNFAVAAIAGLSFYFFGFGLMFSDGSPFVGLGGFMLAGLDNSPATGEAYKGIFGSLNWTGVPLEAKFFFQACFAMAAASIVSGAVAERMKFAAYMIFSILLVAVIYPITGHWIWGGGWLAGRGFWDFAGSTQVHSIGGWAALTGALFVGARRGKFGKDGKIRPIPGHSLSLATAGGFILWLGWFGFNAGSTMAADPGAIAHIGTTTLLASLGGIVGAILLNFLRTRNFDLTMMINGCLAGLVGVTAPCAFVSATSSVLIGLVAGAIAVYGVVFFDRIRVDDPVGATSVHLAGGIWGTLALGLFAESRFSEAVGNGLFFGGGWKLLGAQALGVVAVGGFVLVASSLIWFALRVSIGLRVDEEEEYVGLDLAEIGVEAYAADSIVTGSAATQPSHGAVASGQMVEATH